MNKFRNKAGLCLFSSHNANMILFVKKLFTIIFAIFGSPIEGNLESHLPERRRCSKHADLHTSSKGYLKRFKGPVGSYILMRQNQAINNCLESSEKLRILDVGGGHGQNIETFLRLGHQVTVLGTNETVPFNIERHVNDKKISYVTGSSLESLPFADGSFDICVSLRQLSHVTDYQSFIHELSRVAARAVIFDYAPLNSVNFLYPILFPLKKMMEPTTRPYRIFRQQTIESLLQAESFIHLDYHRQFTLPVGIHRLLGLPGLTRTLENYFEQLGVTAAFGSPVIIFARK